MREAISDIREGFFDCIHLVIALPTRMFGAAIEVIAAFMRHERI
jgi:hypothetical protein